MNQRILIFFSCLAVLLTAQSAGAHSAPGSAVMLDFHADRVDAELRLPLSELELSFREPLLAEPATIVARFQEKLAAYIRQHITLRSPDDRVWTIALGEMHVALDEEPLDLVVQLEMRPPAGASTRRFTFNDDAIVHEVINHITFVAVRYDWNHAVFPDRPELLAPMRFFSKSLAIDRSGGSRWIGLRARLMAGGDYLFDHPMVAAIGLLLPLLLWSAWHPIALALRGARGGWRLAHRLRPTRVT